MNAMKMDAKRSICSVKMIIIIVALVFTLIFSSWDMIRASKKDIFAYGVIDMLGTALMMDKFKVLMVMFTAGIYTAGFCYDFKHHYIRMILARTDLISYSISKFIVNTVATVYKGNIIKNLIMDCQSYTKYRPNETTGGIFVSWRRKEELPTGA